MKGMIVFTLLVAAETGCGASREYGNGPGPAADAFTDADAEAQEASSGMCTDRDGDGYGRGCAAGLDCDDNDSLHYNDCSFCFSLPAEGCLCAESRPVECFEGPEGAAGVGTCSAGTRACLGTFWGECEGQVLPAAVELCNGIDDNCDGRIDDGAIGDCGTCDPRCSIDGIGRDADTPWSPMPDNSDGVSVNEEGGLVLDAGAADAEPVIWVANTGQGSVSKIDTRTFEELGRYRTGYDPSRTSVNIFGDVYVGNRGGQSVTKVSIGGHECPDTNGDTLVTTSDGGDLLGPGQDDCVIWTTDLGGHGVVRAVAAQDVINLSTAIVQHSVWAGSWEGKKLWKLDGMTGEILIGPVNLPARPYGFAMDGRGNLWVMGREPNHLIRVDTARCVDDASCSVTACGEEGDDCTIQSIPMPIQGYGITVDGRQRVWIGRGVARYDPFKPPGMRWTVVGVPVRTHGVAADASGWIWAAAWNPDTGGRGVYRIDADNPSDYIMVPGSNVGSPKGVAVDSDGKIWIINREHDNATVIIPGPTIDDNSVLTNVSHVFVGPYTYSDMTGLQQRLAMAPWGFYKTVFEGCDEGMTEWLDLSYDVLVPEHATVVIRVRTADDIGLLASSHPVSLARIPADSPPVSIAGAFDGEAVVPGRFLEVELVLASDPTDSSAPPVPVIYSIFVTHTCDGGDVPMF